MKFFVESGRSGRGRQGRRLARPAFERFEERMLLSNTIVVSSTGDTGLGTLRQAILGANASGQATVIDFNISGTGPFVIAPATALPAIGVPVTIDGTTEPGIELSGGGQAFDGLTLGAGAGGSTIQGLTIADFGGSGIVIQSNGNAIVNDRIGTDLTGTAAGPGNGTGITINGTGNSIGGTTAGAANTIAFNTGTGVDVVSGSGNAIHQNAIFANGSAIVLATGANNGIVAPSLRAVASIPTLATVDYTLTGIIASSYTVEFFASSTLGGPAQDYLGSVTTTLTSATESFTSSLNLAAPLAAGQTVTATITDGTGDTSAFATSVVPVSPFVVTNTSDNVPGSEVGSLRLAIQDANLSPPASGTDTITFAIPGTSPFVIAPTSALPVITVPVTIDGSSETGIELSGRGQAFDGLTLGGGGSTVQGLSIFGFGLAGIGITSNDNTIAADQIGGTAAATGNQTAVSISGLNNTIGGTTTGAANTIGFNSQAGVDVVSGSGNTIPQNQYVGMNGTSAFVPADDIVIAAGANNSQPAPVLGPVLLSGGRLSTSVTDAVTSGTSVTIDLYLLNSSSNPHSRQYLSSETVTVGSGPTTTNFSLPSRVSVILGDQVIATATVAASGTSVFSSPAVITTPFLVTNTNDSGAGSLRNAIEQVDLNPTPAPQLIGFLLQSQSQTLYNINLLSPLPTITSPIYISGATQPNYSGTPVIEINGGGGAFDGLTLGSGSSGSTITGLDIANFGGTGLVIQSSDNLITNDAIGINLTGTAAGPGNANGISIRGSGNTIGGTTAGASNTIAFNTGTGVDVVSGSGNAIHQNAIFANGSAIVLATGANNAIVTPSVLAVTSVASLTTIDYRVTGTIGQSDTVEFFASGSLGGPAEQFLQAITTPVLTSATQSFTASLSLAAPLANGVTVTASITDGTGDTSALAASMAQSAPFVVTNTSDNVPGSEVGSLRVAIQDANLSPPASGKTDAITFGIQGSLTIAPTSALPTITEPVTIDGTSEPGIQLSGPTTGTLAGTFAGLTFGAGSDASVVQGLTIQNFSDGIQIINASNVNIGGAAANSIGNNAAAGIAILSGTGNTVGSNAFFGTNGASAPAGDIVVANGANGAAIPTVLLDGAVSIPPSTGSTGNLYATLVFSPAFTTSGSTQVSFDFYTVDTASNPPSRTFLQSTAAIPVPTQPYTVDLSVPSTFSTTEQIAAFATFVGSRPGPNGSSAFSTQPITSASPTEVYTTADNPSASATIGGSTINGIAGSLRFAINYANSFGKLTTSTPITFAIPTADPNHVGTTYTITPTSLLPPIKVPVQIQGQSEGGGSVVIISGNGLPGSGLQLALGSGGSTIEGLVIGGFTGAGIEVDSASNMLLDNHLGTSPAGNKLGNGIGINVLGNSNTIQGNTIGFNNSMGVQILAQGPIPGGPTTSVSGNLLLGNDIGTDSNGDAFGNLGVGILIEATDTLTNSSGSTIGGSASVFGNMIGGTASGAGNTIGFNSGAGIAIEAIQNSTLGAVSASNNLVQGNDIGGVPSDSTSQAHLLPSPYPNGGPGILLMAQGTNVDLSGNMIGGPATVTGPAGALGMGANFILGNQGDGIAVSLASAAGTLANTIEGNLVSHNQLNGIHLVGDLTGATALGSISDNLVGTDPSGTATYDPTGHPWGNGLSGILIEESSTSSKTLSGIAATVTGNVLSGNGLSGVTVDRYTGTHVSTSITGTTISTVTTTITGTSTARVGISGNIIGLDRTGENSIVYNSIGGTTTGGVALPMGNALDGVLLDNVVGVVVGSTVDSTVPTTPSNVISGNLGRGIEIRGDLLNSSSTSFGNTIQGNFIGTDFSGEVPVQTVGIGGTTYTLGNLSDGIFLYVPQPTTILDNLISNNRAAGIHAAAQGQTTTGSLQIAGNFIGTDATGTASSVSINGSTISLGNGSDGLFIDSIEQSVTIGGAALGGNVISGNRANGIDLLDASKVDVASNAIGTNFTGALKLGNSSNGIFLNGSSEISIGGTTSADANILSGNLDNGILLANNANDNTIAGNRIGTDATGISAVPNSADGVFLLAGPATIGGTTISGGAVMGNILSGNSISGNSEYGVQIFGKGATANRLFGNTIGASVYSSGQEFPPGNAADGVSLNNDGGGNTVGPRNVISGNAQSGVLIFGTWGDGGKDLITGNWIGTDPAVSVPVPNGGNGIFIFGTSSNSIGGNTISANAQAGVAIFSPATTALASSNLLYGNLIGGAGKLGNQSDGVAIESGAGNTIGQLGSWNTIAGNMGNGIDIVRISNQSPDYNTLSGNIIGLIPGLSTGVNPQQNGVLVQDGTGNQIGVAMGPISPNSNVPVSPSNVISGNAMAGVQFGAGASGNLVQGNDIGVGLSGGRTGSSGNGLAGVFINNTGTGSSNEIIGGSGAGEGNVIGGSAAGYGIDILGPVSDTTPAGNVVEGNLIGIDRNSNPAGNSIGVYIQNSWGNQIGISGTKGANVISANVQAGVSLTGLYSTRNIIEGNRIGTDLTGTMRPGGVSALTASAPASLQTFGVEISTPSPTYDTSVMPINNQILDNQISGNLIGVGITGVGSRIGTGQGVPLGRDLIAGNLIGTGRLGTTPNPNFEYGVYIENSAGNTVGGTASGSANVLSANGIDGVEIFGGTSQSTGAGNKATAASAGNRIVGNIIGETSQSQPGFNGGGPQVQTPDGPIITLGQQLYGVVIIGSSGNQIGYRGHGNTIGGNVNTGVYITRNDFQGDIFTVPTGNTVRGNQIVSNRVYGVFRYQSPDNPVGIGRQRGANTFAGNDINLADYIKSLNSNTQLTIVHPKIHRGKRHVTVATHHHGHPASRHAGHSRAHHHAMAMAMAARPVRPRIPALFVEGAQARTIDLGAGPILAVEAEAHKKKR